MLAILTEKEAQQAKKGRIKDKIAKKELELQVLMLQDALFHVEQELRNIEEKRSELSRIARILFDDEEVLLLLQ